MARPRRSSSKAVLSLCVAAALMVSACGSSSEADRPELVVFAASSLEPALVPYADSFPGAEIKLSLGGSDALAAQIRQGLVPDVYASADEQLALELAQQGLVSAPLRFASNRLVVVATPESRVDSLGDLARPGISIAIGSESVPVGAYARQVIDEMPAARRESIFANVVTEESSALGIVGKLTQGAVDAGFLYATDAAAIGGISILELPSRIAPDVSYAAAPTAESQHAELARAFVEGLTESEGRRALRLAGFGRPE